MNENKEEYLTEEETKEVDELLSLPNDEKPAGYMVYLYQDGSFEEKILETDSWKEAKETFDYVYADPGPFLGSHDVKPGLVFVELVDSVYAGRIMRKAIEIVE